MQSNFKTNTSMRGRVRIIKERLNPCTGLMELIEEVDVTNKLHPEAIKNRKDILEGRACDKSDYMAKAYACCLGVSLKPSGELFDEENRMDTFYKYDTGNSQGGQYYSSKYDTLHCNLYPYEENFQIKLAAPLTVGNREELGEGTDKEILEKYLLTGDTKASRYEVVYQPLENGHSHTIKSNTRINVQFTPKSNIKEGSKIYGVSLFNYTGFDNNELNSSSNRDNIAEMEAGGIRIIKGATPLTVVKLDKPIAISPEDYIRVIYDVIVVTEYYIELGENQGIHLSSSEYETSSLNRMRPIWFSLLNGEWAPYGNGRGNYLGTLLKYLGRNVISTSYLSPTTYINSDENKTSFDIITSFTNIKTKEDVDSVPKNTIYLNRIHGGTDFYNSGKKISNSYREVYSSVNPAYNPKILKYSTDGSWGFSGNHIQLYKASANHEWTANWLVIQRIAEWPSSIGTTNVDFAIFTKFPEPIVKTRYNKFEVTLVHDKGIDDMTFEGSLIHDMTKEEEELYEV